jgi:hypothetical protein
MEVGVELSKNLEAVPEDLYSMPHTVALKPLPKHDFIVRK